jgi:hypothetical protein
MSPSIGRLIDLAEQLSRDAERSPDALRRRDRALGRELLQRGRDAESQVAAWLDRVRPEGGPTTGEQAERATRVLGLLLVAFGLFAGAGAALALFWYDGSHPVNVVRVIGVFVGLQLLLLCATLVLCLPERWRRFVPGLAGLQEALSLLSPGRWQRALRQLLPASRREAASRLAGLARRHHRLYGDVERWWLLSNSQAFGVAFNLGALAVAMGLIAFTDLAFGWSTTLDVHGADLERVTHLLSRPWAGVWPSAVPSTALIEATRYFRENAHHDPAASAPWWRFLLACMLLYGLVPRALMLGFARVRLHFAVRRAFRAAPGLAALRDRLSSRLVETVGEGDAPEAARGPEPKPHEGPTLPPGVRCRAIVWSGFPLDGAAEASAVLGVDVLSLHRAGEADLERDAAAIRALVEAGGEEPVVVIAKAWEPPVLELLDFLADLRKALGARRAVVVVPLGLSDAGRPVAPAPRDALQWQRAADRLGDPWTSVHARARE